MIKYLAILSFILLPIILSCHSGRKTTSNTPQPGISSVSDNQKEDMSSIEKFDDFYYQFHIDSIFQMSRIRFPLGGKKCDETDEYAWTRENWQILRRSVYDVDPEEYTIIFEKKDTTAFERIYLPDSGFDFQCRFEQIDGVWFLVYCLDQEF